MAITELEVGDEASGSSHPISRNRLVMIVFALAVLGALLALCGET